jgi:hypothetical protein
LANRHESSSYFSGDHYGYCLLQNAYFANPSLSPKFFQITTVAREGKDIRFTCPPVGGPD